MIAKERDMKSNQSGCGRRSKGKKKKEKYESENGNEQRKRKRKESRSNSGSNNIRPINSLELTMRYLDLGGEIYEDNRKKRLS